MPILQIFRKDRKYWSEADIQQVQLFFMLHPFFSKFYEHDDFDKVVNFTFYSRLQQNQELRLQVNKKSEMMILLQGEVTIYRKILPGQLKKKQKRQQKELLHDEYIKMGQYSEANQMIELRNDVIVKSKATNSSEILFVPTLLYETHNYIVNNRKLERLLQVLQKIFKDANKRDLKTLAESGCIFKEYKMNNYIYRAGTAPEYCYILVSGNVKIQSAGFSAKKMLDMSIISQNTLFGDRDLNQEARTHNAICCSAHCKTLALKKEAYNRFIAKNKHINPSYAQKLKAMISEKTKVPNILVKQYEQKHLLPRVIRFSSYTRPQQQQKIQKDLLQNCHMLINLSPPKRSTSSFRSPSDRIDKDYSVSQFDKKLSLYKRIESHRSHNGSNSKLF